jgi:predicted metal-dependent hydrolase
MRATALLSRSVQRNLFPRSFRANFREPDRLWVGTRFVELWFFRNRRARRYILRVRPDGSARVTVPRQGSLTEARQFAERNATWIEQQVEKRLARPMVPPVWLPGTLLLYHGEKTALEVLPHGQAARLADQVISLVGANGDLRPFVERHLWNLAWDELVPRTRELAALHQVTIKRITVRNQCSRWGSSSAKRTISLNWRLVQTPAWVRDYIILHELMHLREMNHSWRFWHLVEQVCPNYKEAEKWLNQNSELLRGHPVRMQEP